jgi:type IX secretion system substrate protein/FG-GAP repeat protein
MKQLFIFILFPFIVFGQIQIGNDINGEAAGDQFGLRLSLSSDGSIVAIGALNNDGNGSDSGHVRVYKDVSGVWTQVGSDIDGQAAFERSGIVSLSSNGSIVAIGGENNVSGDESGHVRVYKDASGVWTQVGSDINGESIMDHSGIVSISSDGSIVAIGAPQNGGGGNSSGHVRVYKDISGVWTQVGIDIDGEAANDLLGWSVSLSSDGSIVAIGAINSSGYVGVYDLSVLLSSNSFVLSQFKLYPNPVKEQFTIQLSKSLKLQKVNIYNSLGQFISFTKKKFVNTANLSQGFYFVEIETNKGKATKKIVVEK